jgi:hypothetical protein
VPTLFLGLILIGAAVYCAVLGAKQDSYGPEPRQLSRAGYGVMSLALLLLGLAHFVFPGDAFSAEPTPASSCGFRPCSCCWCPGRAC